MRRAQGLAALVGLAVLAGALRARPLLLPHGAQSSVSYDEGVYLAAAGLLSEGAVPYRDFVLLHPPGLLLLLLPLSLPAPDLLGWDDVLVAARWLAVAVGVANVLLLARLVARWRGPVAGLVAGVLHAGYGPAVVVESHAVLEPFVLLLVLVCATAWLSTDAPSRGRLRAVGAAAALAGLVKLTGGLVLLAVLASDGRGRTARQRAVPVLWAGLTAAVLLAPFLVLAGPRRVVEQVLLAQTGRPGGDVDGGSVVGVRARLVDSLRTGVLGVESVPDVVVLGVVVAVALLAVRAALVGGRDGRFWAVALVVLLLPLLVAPDFYPQYPVPAAAAVAALLGGAAGDAARALRERGRGLQLAGAAGLALVLVAGVAATTKDVLVERRSAETDAGAAVAGAVPDAACLVAVPPDLALAAGRLPVRDGTGTALADPFGALLHASLRAGAPGTSTQDLLHARPAQDRLRAALTSCPFVVLGGSPGEDPRFSPSTARWFTERFAPVEGLDAGRGVLHELTAATSP